MKTKSNDLAWLTELSVRAYHAIVRAELLQVDLQKIQEMARTGELIKVLAVQQNCGKKTILEIYEVIGSNACDVFSVPRKAIHQCEFGHMHILKKHADECRVYQEKKRKNEIRMHQARVALRAFFVDVAKGVPMRRAAREHGLSQNTAEIKLKRILLELWRIWSPNRDLVGSALRLVRTHANTYIKLIEENPHIPKHVHWNAIPDKQIIP